MYINYAALSMKVYHNASFSNEALIKWKLHIFQHLYHVKWKMQHCYLPTYIFSFNFIIKCKILDCHNFLIHISLNTASQQPNIDHPIGGHFCLKRFRCLLLKVEPLTQAFVRLVEQNHPSCSQNKNVVQMNIVCRVELSSFQTALPAP